MQPTFTHLPEMKMLGLAAKFISILSPQKNNYIVIPALWHDYQQRFREIPHRIDGASYGLIEMLPPHEKSNPAELLYIAATQVTQLDAIPTGMITRTLPGRYALFTHKGPLTTLGDTMNDIYQTWLPTSHQKLRPTPHLERYNHRFQLNSPQSEFDILLPIEEPAV